MSYKSIVTLLHDPESTMSQLEYAILASRYWDAHLHVICIGIDKSEVGFYGAGSTVVTLQHHIEQAHEATEKLEQIVAQKMQSESIAWSVEATTVLSAGVSSFVADQTRFFDLAIMAHPGVDKHSKLDEMCLEACLFTAGIPAIVVPSDAVWQEPTNRVLVAWDDGAAALSAIRSAAPLLADARATEILMIAPPLDGSERSDPGGRLARKLTRLGARVEIAVTAQRFQKKAHQINRRAVETDCDLIVMGAYGHSRLREAIFGGVTRSMLRKADLPILLAH